MKPQIVFGTAVVFLRHKSYLPDCGRWSNSNGLKNSTANPFALCSDGKAFAVFFDGYRL